jgi:hypothetical protein
LIDDDPERSRPTGGEPPARDSAQPEVEPDGPTSATYLGRINPAAPVSGHVRPGEGTASLAASPENDWAAAKAVVMPLLRPAGTGGMPLSSIDAAWLAAEATRSHTNQVVVDPGPAGLVVVFALPADGFDAIVNGDHLLSWRVDGAAVRQAAMANLQAWSATAPWTDDVDGERRVLSSETGDGWDASRILLPEARRYVTAELAVAGRVLVGLPERHLLVAASLRDGDPEFGRLFAEFVLDHADGSEEPIDRHVFELTGDELVARSS